MNFKLLIVFEFIVTLIFLHFQHHHENGHTKAPPQHHRESFENPYTITYFLAYLGFYTLMCLGAINQFLFPPKVATEKHRDGYVPLYDKFEQFYLNYVYRRMKDCFNKPISSVPANVFTIKDRITEDNGWSFRLTGKERQCMNLGSYNYLGFAQNEGPCAEESQKSLEKYGVALCSSRRELGEIRAAYL